MKDKVLYIIQSSNGLIKIGRSINPEIRRKTFESQSNNECKIINQINNSGQYELQLLKKYKKYKVRNEWFSLSDNEIEWLKKLTLKELKRVFTIREVGKKEANTTLYIDPKLKMKAQILAIESEKSLTTLIIEAINQYLKTSKL